MKKDGMPEKSVTDILTELILWANQNASLEQKVDYTKEDLRTLLLDKVERLRKDELNVRKYELNNHKLNRAIDEEVRKIIQHNSVVDQVKSLIVEMMK